VRPLGKNVARSRQEEEVVMGRILAVLLVVVCALVVGSPAQSGPLPIGTVTSVGAGNCSASGWISGSQVTCNHALVNCPEENGVSVAQLGITFAYETPSHLNGTIVFFSDGDGTSPVGNQDLSPSTHNITQYATDYYNAGYQVVQTAWDMEWEDPTNGSGGNIGSAACRPAAFLSYVRFGSSGNPALWTTGGMCTQGESAGGAAGVYALAWYGAGSGIGQHQNYLDKLSLLSAPPLADIEQGCKVVGEGLVLVEVCPSGQLGCNSANNPLSWTQYVEYSDAAAAVRDWSGLNSCAAGSTTSSANNAAWKAMSIVDGNIGAFSYPSTNITGWVCSSVASGDGPMNNSSPEAQLFFQQFTNSSQYQGLTINGVSGCLNDEQVGGGTPPSSYHVTYGWQAIESDMKDSVNGCVVHH
jgi:hypothetical protein